MSRFYGIYLQNTELSTALDLVRFLCEPDSIRFSHVTLRGPYNKRLARSWIEKINSSSKYDWSVRLTEPGTFFSNIQFTVIVKIDLMTLRDLVFKPYYRNSIPHMTLYDGGNRDFGSDLFDIVSRYDWKQSVKVSRLREIDAKAKVDEVFIPFFMSFHQLFQKYVGDTTEIPHVKSIPSEKRLDIIEKILLDCSDKISMPRLKMLSS